MKNSKTTTALGIGMIVGSIPFTLAGGLVIYLMVVLEEVRAAGRVVGFDAIGVVMMAYFAYLLALGSCIAGLLYFGLGVLSRRISPSRWHWFGIAYSLGQATLATIYIATR